MARFVPNNNALAQLSKRFDGKILAAGKFVATAAQYLCPVDTGNLRDSYASGVKLVGPMTVRIGTNVEYAKFVEYGTGVFNPQGRRTPWVYIDEQGIGHTTSGMKPRPHLLPALVNNKREVINIIRKL